MAAAEFDTRLVRVRLDVPIFHKLDESITQLTVVTTHIDARLTGKTFQTVDSERLKVQDVLKVKQDAVGMLPYFSVLCYPKDEARAVELIHEALQRWLMPMLAYYRVMGDAVKNPLEVKTREQFMDELMQRPSKNKIQN